MNLTERREGYQLNNAGFSVDPREGQRVKKEDLEEHIMTTLSETGPLPAGGTSKCFLERYVKQVILDTPNFPANLAIPPLAPKAYRVGSIPGKGIGALATRDIKRGELVMAERPLIACCRSAPVSILSYPVITSWKISRSCICRRRRRCSRSSSVVCHLRTHGGFTRCILPVRRTAVGLF
ncbi:hypothetical protein BDV98DRAFT_574148 [Pterulicium gracile]|uniref:Uncharacterized protein n=1 Tax=Pterulicium gracile TaxID=1884261 RepID=A0A5C3Q6Q4_9AGAR|nr:hypothetical protein BDV98DRAFT_574148 [Pterula gracilis]